MFIQSKGGSRRRIHLIHADCHRFAARWRRQGSLPTRHLSPKAPVPHRVPLQLTGLHALVQLLVRDAVHAFRV